MGTPRNAGRPTMAQTEALSDAILRAAFRVFVREGYALATMNMVAKECGTTRRSIGHRFGDKNDLLFAVLKMVSVQQGPRVTLPATLLALDPLEAVRRACHSLCHMVCEDVMVDFHRLVMVAVAEHPTAGEFMIRMNDDCARELKAFVVRAQGHGHFAGQNAEATTTGLIGVFVSNPINRAALGDARFRNPISRERYIDEMWRVVALSSAGNE